MSGETPIAVLPMYDFPWIAAANDALCASIATRLAEAGVRAPMKITRGGDLAARWRHSSLIFGQTCGYPYVTALKEMVTLIAAPDIRFPAARRRRTEVSSSGMWTSRAERLMSFAGQSPQSTLMTVTPA